MRILYYKQNESITERRLLGSLIELGLSIEQIRTILSSFSFFTDDPEASPSRLIQAITHASQSPSPVTRTIPLQQIQEQINRVSSSGKFAAQSSRIIGLLMQSSEMVAPASSPPSGISMEALAHVLAYTYGLDQLKIGSVFLPAFPLDSHLTHENSLIEAVYQIGQVDVFPVKITGKANTWVGIAMLAALAQFEVPQFHFLQSVSCRTGLEGNAVHPLQVILGETETAGIKDVVLIQTNIDDMSPESLSYATLRLFDAGALDIFQTPIYMKKNRLGIQLNVIGKQQDEAKLANLMLNETTTLGVNVQPLDHRYHAETRMVEVETKYGKIPVKQKYLLGTLVQSKPEYEVLSKIAAEMHIPMHELSNEIGEQLRINLP
ncbi:MAG: DUF111 family protein [Anaerolineaceae bacterium]|nr:DUF111 family protein [Anaerolineaceae bacterium]